MADGLMKSSDTIDASFDIDQKDAFLVDLDGFEGPLHLLLTLARRQKVDMRRISVLELAEQYLEFICDAQEKRIDLAADYLLMASWLAYLKSRLLLPKAEKQANEDEGDADDMAARLAFRLQRLEAMRQAATDLMEGDLLGRDVFERGLPERAIVIKRPQYTTRLIDLMAAFAKIQERKTKVRPHAVVKQYVLPLESAREKIEKRLPQLDEWCSLNEISSTSFNDDAEEAKAPGKSRLASLFAASLDMTKAKRIDLRQDGYGAPVLVKRFDDNGNEAHGSEV